MSYDIPGLVETSTNLASITPSNGDLAILMSSRSSVATALAALRQRIRSAGELAGAEVEEGEGYPGWKPDMGSALLGTVRKLHLELLGTEPRGIRRISSKCAHKGRGSKDSTKDMACS